MTKTIPDMLGVMVWMGIGWIALDMSSELGVLLGACVGYLQLIAERVDKS